MSEPPAWEDPRRVMKRHGLAPKKSFSQNFLVSRHAVDRIVEALAPTADEQTVELGPGLGTLTAALLRAGARVLAVDRDRDMLRVLRAELGEVTALELREGDAAALDLRAIAEERGRIALAGNLPYAITGSILRNLTEHRDAVSRAVIMVQREVGARLMAPPGSKTYGALSVFVQAGFDVSLVVRVPAGAFHPPPKVESVVVQLRSRETPRVAETEAFVAIVKAAFGQRRKTLRNALGALGDDAVAAIAAAGIDPAVRAETLSVEDFGAIASSWLLKRGGNGENN